MDNANKRKSEFLGVNSSTAQSKLRKMIIFKLVKESGQDICFQCNDKIETLEELSIEHKKPWFNVSRELFWDLDNIAFSHLTCNVSTAAAGNTYNRILSPQGMVWCTKHQCHLPESKFSKVKGNWTGFRSWCNECRRNFEYK